MPRITLLTDFRTADGFVAAMKGVIAAIAPDAHVDDASHEIPPGDVLAASWTLGAYWNRYPRATVHVVVVDPGVGSDRRALVAEVDGRFVVAPDNGVLTHVLREAGSAVVHAVADVADDVSATFHGRDVFAPVAARIAAGASPTAFAERIDDPVTLDLPEPVRDGGIVRGCVLLVDRFGNLITNISADGLPPEPRVRIGDHIVPFGRTYSDVASGEAVALVGSRGVLEVSVRDGRADDRFGGRGTVVQIPS